MSSNSVDSEEMTVEDENRRNSETDDIHSILDTFMQAREETLEELVGGFMYLTMDDVMQKASSTARAIASNSNADVFRGGNADTTSMLTGVAAPEHCGVKGDNEGGKREGGREQSEDIEEEVLEDGSSSKGRGEDALFRHRPASLTKFDNFLLDDEEAGCDSGKEDGDGSRANKEGEEGEREEDWLPTSGYMASFAADNASSQDPQTTHIPAAAASDPSDPTKPATQQKPAEADSDSDSLSSQHNTPSLSQHVPLDPDPRSQPQAAESTAVDSDSGDGGQSTAPLTLPDTAEAVWDSSSSAVCDSDVEAPPAWTLNPGEVEEEEGEEEGEVSARPVVEPRVSVIEISARVVSSSSDGGQREGDAGSQAGEEECSDDVVPFELDQDYDYDNIVYTPKFTPQEMTYLNSFLPKKS